MRLVPSLFRGARASQVGSKTDPDLNLDHLLADVHDRGVGFRLELLNPDLLNGFDHGVRT